MRAALVTSCLWSSCSAAAALSAFTTARGEVSGRVVPASSPVEPSSLFERLNWPRLTAPEAAQLTPVVRLPGFLSEDDMEQIHALASAVRASSGDDCLSTATKGAQLAEGAWQTIFLNKRLPQLLPALWSRTLQAMSNADAEHFHVLDTARRTLNLRSAEYHEIAPTGSLPHPKHLDYGSLITVDFMLSGSDEFEGGVFSTLEADGNLQPHTFERGDALLFLSHKYHCVSPVTAGRRNVLVAELWEGVARTCPQRCSDPFGPCYCKYEPRQCALIDGGERSAYEPPWVRVRREDTADSPHFVRSQPR